VTKADLICSVMSLLAQDPEATSAPLLDHPIGAADQGKRKSEVEQLRGLQIDDEFNLSRLLNGKIGRLFALENPSDIDTDEALEIGQVAAPIAHEAAGGRKLLSK
jgi:hypothetical protein